MFRITYLKEGKVAYQTYGLRAKKEDILDFFKVHKFEIISILFFGSDMSALGALEYFGLI